MTVLRKARVRSIDEVVAGMALQESTRKSKNVLCVALTHAAFVWPQSTTACPTQAGTH